MGVALACRALEFDYSLWDCCSYVNNCTILEPVITNLRLINRQYPFDDCCNVTMDNAGVLVVRASTPRGFNCNDKLAAKIRAPLDEMPTSTFTSSNVHSGLYDFGERELYMRYLRDAQADAIYRYDNVDAATWNDLQKAQSKGSYINANVAYESQYALFGRDDFPDRHAIGDDFLRGFVYAP